MYFYFLVSGEKKNLSRATEFLKLFNSKCIFHWKINCNISLLKLTASYCGFCKQEITTVLGVNKGQWKGIMWIEQEGKIYGHPENK